MIMAATNAVCEAEADVSTVALLEEELAETVSPMWTWLTERGYDFAIDCAAALVIALLGALVIRLISMGLRRFLLRLGDDRAMVAKFILSVSVKGLWALLAIVVLEKLGVNVGPVIAGLGVTGFVIGFAFQESLGSFAAGLMLALNRPFKIGDYVVLAGHEGSVTAMDMMAVTLATADNRKVTIPNKQAWGSPIVNFSALELRRVDFTVGIDYGADIALARRTALETLSKLDGVLADPAPLAEVRSLDDSAVTLTVRAWAKNSDYWKVYFAGTREIKVAFDKAGVPIPFPQLDVRMVQS